MKKLILILLLSGCANIQPVADSWKGKQLDDVVTAWGAPDRVMKLNNGNRVASWETNFMSMGYSYHCKTWVVSDTSGRVLEMKQEGDNAACRQFLSSKGA